MKPDLKIQVYDATGTFSEQWHQDVRHFTSALSQCGLSIVESPAQCLKQNNYAWDNPLPENQKILIIFEPAQTAIAHLISTGRKPSAALEDWMKITRSMIVFWRKNRKAALLLPASALQGDLKELSAKMGARFEGQPITLPEGPITSFKGRSFYMVLAQQKLAENLEARRLLGELEAGMLCASSMTNQTDQAYKEIEQKNALIKSMEQQQNDLKNELEIVRTRDAAQMDILEAELEEIKARSAQQQHHLEFAQRALEEKILQPHVAPDYSVDYERELLGQSKKMQGLKIELEAWQQRHINDQELLKVSAENITNCHAAIETLQNELQERTAEIKELRESNSWKVTKPVRLAKDIVIGSKNNKV